MITDRQIKLVIGSLLHDIGKVVEALKDVNLNIDSGDIYGIIGMSGAGKSTLVRCMNFLEIPTEGQVLIDGKALGDLTETGIGIPAGCRRTGSETDGTEG